MLKEPGHVLQKLAKKVQSMSERMKQLEAENLQLRSESQNCTATEPEDGCSKETGRVQNLPNDQELQNIQRILAECGAEAGQDCAQV